MVQLCIAAGSKTAIDVEVTIVGEGLFRLDEEPLLFLAADNESEIGLFPRYGDTIFGERIDETTIRYLGVCERGQYNHYDFIVTEKLAESPRMAEFLNKVVHDGGHWERRMGGVLVLSLPKASLINPSDFMVKEDSGA
jgi:hypothetical protein